MSRSPVDSSRLGLPTLRADRTYVKISGKNPRGPQNRPLRVPSPEEDTSFSSFESEDSSEPGEAPARFFSSTVPTEDSSVDSAPYARVIAPDNAHELPTPPPTVGSRARSDSELTVVPVAPKPAEWFAQSPKTPVGQRAASWQHEARHHEAAAQPPPPLPPPARTPSKNPALAALGLRQPAVVTPAPPNSAAPTPNPPSRPQAPPKPMAAPAANADEMYRARKRLDNLPNFDGEETKETEAVWRKRFENYINSLQPSAEQKVELWIEKVEAGSVAQDWLDSIPRTDIDTWTKLTAELTARWPGQSAAEKARVKVDNWYAHTFDESRMLEMVDGNRGEKEVYYAAWARKHMMLSTTMGGDEPSKLQYTWSRVIPPALKEALRKGLGDYTTVSGLCSDIIGLEQDRVKLWAGVSSSKALVTPEETTRSLAANMEELSRRMDKLSFISQNPQPRAPRSNLRFATPPNVAPPQPAYSTPNPPTATRLASRLPPTPQTPGPLGAPFSPRPPATPAKGRTFDDNQAGHQAYTAAKAALAGESLSANNSLFPLSPGTMKQSLKVCVRCGKGEHLSSTCTAPYLPEPEMKWRNAVRNDFLRESMFGRNAKAPGVQANELFLILADSDMWHEAETLLVDEEEEVESGNGWGQQ
ncbi:hypothetical protein FS749_008581 [Ceratobasidium sp. UAMH 11750]|nr:hypothetical protein FS749_008581 [Ceratobasidium sp. UAMH 11750]